MLKRIRRALSILLALTLVLSGAPVAALADDAPQAEESQPAPEAKPAEKPVEKPTEKSEEKPAEKQEEKAEEKPAEKVEEKPTDPPEQRATDAATAAPAVEATAAPAVEATAAPAETEAAAPAASETPAASADAPTEAPSDAPSESPAATEAPEGAVEAPEVSPSATATPAAAPKPEGVRFTEPKDGAIVPGEEKLRVRWEIRGANYGFLFSARNLKEDRREEDSFIYKKAVKKAEYELKPGELPFDTGFELWVGALDAEGNVAAEDRIKIQTGAAPEAAPEATPEADAAATVEPEATPEPEASTMEVAIDELLPDSPDMPVVPDIMLTDMQQPFAVTSLAAPQNVSVNDDYILTWSPVEGAEEYEVRVYPQGNPDAPLGSMSGFTECSVELTWLTAKGSGSYVAEVCAVNGDVYSEPGRASFEIRQDKLLATPEITLDGTPVVGTALSIHWTAVEEATSYYLEIRKHNDGETYYQTIGDESYDGSVTQASISGGYFSKVGKYRLVLTASREGYFSSEAVKDFTVESSGEALAAPVIQEIVAYAGLDCAVAWSAVPGAQEYLVETVLPDADGVSTTWDSTTVAACTYTIRGEDLVSEGVGREGVVTVTAVAPGREGTPATRTFTVQLGWDAAPANLRVEGNYVLNWDEMEGADSYFIVLDGDGGRESQTVAQPPVDLDYSLQQFGPGEYEISVQGFSNTKGLSQKSTTSVVFEGAIALDAPENLQVDDNYILRWDSVANADAYEITYVTPYAGGQQRSETVSECEFDLLGAVSNGSVQGGDYTFNVRAKSTRTGASSDAASKQVAIPALTLKLNSDYYVNAPITVTWDGPDAEIFDIDFSNGQTENSGFSGFSRQKSYEIAKTYLTAVGECSVVIRCEINNHYWNDGKTFRLIAPLGELSAPVFRDTGELKIHAPGEISWEPVANATSYLVYHKGPGDSDLYKTWREQTETTYSLTPEALGSGTLEVMAIANGWKSATGVAQYTVTADGTVEAPAIAIDELTAQNTVPVSTDLHAHWPEVAHATGYTYKLKYEKDEYEGYASPCYGPEATIYGYEIERPGKYTLTVTAKGEAGWSDNSTSVEFTAEGGKLDKVTNLKLDGNYTLSWDATPNAEEYQVLLDFGGTSFTETSVNLFEHFGNSIEPDVEYTASVTARAEGWEPSDAAEVRFTVPGELFPGTPEFVNFPETAPELADLTLRWNPVKNASAYRLELPGGWHEPPLWVAEIDGGATSWTIPGEYLTGVGRSYDVKLTAFGPDGNVSRSVMEFVELVEPYGALEAPVIDEIADAQAYRDLRISWSAVANATDYFVELQLPGEEYPTARQTSDLFEVISADWITQAGEAKVAVVAYAEGYAEGRSAEVTFTIRPAEGNLSAPEVEIVNAVSGDTLYLGDAAEFRWPPVAHASRYEAMLYYPAGGYDALSVEEAQDGALRCAMPGELTLTGEYRLSVRASGDGWVPSAAEVKLNVTERPALDAPVVKPIEDCFVDEPVVAYWDGPEEAESYLAVLERKGSDGAWSGVASGTTEEFYFDFGERPEGDYRVRVTAMAERYQDGVSKDVTFKVKAYFKYRISGGKAIVTGYLGDETDIAVPATLDGCPVTEIGDGAFEGDRSIHSVTLPSSVTKVGARSFKNCTGLERFDGPGVTSVGSEAFAGCTNLKELNLGTVTELGDGALTDVPERAYDFEIEVGFDDETGDPSHSPEFSGNLLLREIHIKDGTKKIPARAFKGCANVENIYLPESLRSIGSEAFAGCTSAKKVVLYEDCTSIAGDAFSGDSDVSFVLYQRDVNAMSYARQYAQDHGIPCTVLPWETQPSAPTVQFGDDSYTVFAHVPVTIRVTAANASQVRMFVNGADVGVFDVDKNGDASFPYTFTELGEFEVYFRSESKYDQIETPVKTVTVQQATMHFTAPLDEDIVPAKEPLALAWSGVPGIDHYEFSARYLDQEQPFINHQIVKGATGASIGVEQLLLAREMQLWVGAYTADNFNVCGETIRVRVGVGLPEVQVQVDRKTMTASWAPVPGAARYVYSLRDLNSGESKIEHAAADGLSVVLTLEGGKKYRLAVAAVPEGVDDVAHPEMCGWCEVEFETEQDAGVVHSGIRINGIDRNTNTCCYEGTYTFWIEVQGEPEQFFVYRGSELQSVEPKFESGNKYTYTLEVKANRQVIGVRVRPEEPLNTIAIYGIHPLPHATKYAQSEAKLRTWPSSDGAVKHTVPVNTAVEVHGEITVGETKYCYVKYSGGMYFVEEELLNSAQKVLREIEIISPKETVTVGQDILVKWTPVAGAQHYEFAARNVDEQEQFIVRQNIGNATSYKIEGRFIKPNKEITLWVAAFGSTNAEEMLCQTQVTVKVICNHLKKGEIKKVEEDKLTIINEVYHSRGTVIYNEFTCLVCMNRIKEIAGSSYKPELHRFNQQGVCVCGYRVDPAEGKEFNDRVDRYKELKELTKKKEKQLVDLVTPGLVGTTSDEVEKDNSKWFGLKSVAKYYLGNSYRAFSDPVELWKDFINGEGDEAEYVDKLLYNSVLHALDTRLAEIEPINDNTLRVEALDELNDAIREGRNFAEDLYRVYKDWKAYGQIAEIVKEATVTEEGVKTVPKLNLGGLSSSLSQLEESKTSYLSSFGIDTLIDFVERGEVTVDKLSAYFNLYDSYEKSIMLLDDMIEQATNYRYERMRVVCEEYKNYLLEMDKDKMVEKILVEEEWNFVGDVVENAADAGLKCVFWNLMKDCAKEFGGSGKSALIVEALVLGGELIGTSAKIEGQEQIVLLQALKEVLVSQYQVAVSDERYEDTENSTCLALMLAQLELEGLDIVKTLNTKGLLTVLGVDIDNVQSIQSKRTQIQTAINELCGVRQQMEDDQYDDIRDFI